MKDKFFVSVGEVSGDLHLSYLVENILSIDPESTFMGVVGEKSIKAGVKPLDTIDSIAVMGFIEAVKKYKYLKNKSQEYIDIIKKEKINKIILVDYGGFNLRFLELIKKEAPKVEVFYYIPPKVWIWGEKRVEKLRLADHIVVIFPWEVEFYKKHDIKAVYFGNPLSEKYLKVEREENNILLLPGSRKQEVEKMIPTMLEVVKQMPKTSFLLKLARNEDQNWIKEDLSLYSNLKLETESSLSELVKKSEIAIATSGTVTLELALLGILTIVVYKSSALNVFIARHILKVGYISLPNLTLNKEVFPELIQEQYTSESIKENIENLRENKKTVELDIREVRSKLSGNDILKNYSKYFLKGN